MDNSLAGKRVLIRNVDKTDDIKSIRFLPDGRIGIVFKGLDIEYKYNPANITLFEEHKTPQVDQYELAQRKLLEREQQVLNSIIACTHDTLYSRIYSHAPFLSPYHNLDKNHLAEPYKNFLNNPYFAKMKFADDKNSYYISEHNINKLSSEINLPENVKIISVYSDLGRHIYDRRATFLANTPLEKLIPIGENIYRYNIDAKMNSGHMTEYNIIEKLRFDIRDGKIRELKDETPR